jgi:hypothetical protein
MNQRPMIQLVQGGGGLTIPFPITFLAWEAGMVPRALPGFASRGGKVRSKALALALALGARFGRERWATTVREGFGNVTPQTD